MLRGLDPTIQWRYTNGPMECRCGVAKSVLKCGILQNRANTCSHTAEYGGVRRSDGGVRRKPAATSTFQQAELGGVSTAKCNSDGASRRRSGLRRTPPALHQHNTATPLYSAPISSFLVLFIFFRFQSKKNKAWGTL